MQIWVLGALRETYSCTSMWGTSGDNVTTADEACFAGHLVHASPATCPALYAHLLMLIAGDVTTTMLWIHGQITPLPTMVHLLLPSLVSLAVPLTFLCTQAPEFQGPSARVQDETLTAAAAVSIGYSGQLQLSSSATKAADVSAGAGNSSTVGVTPSPAGNVQETFASQGQQSGHAAASSSSSMEKQPADEGEQQLLLLNRDLLVLSIGLGALLFVPLFKYLTGLPPYMGMLSGLAVLWMVTDALHWGESRQYPRVQDALRNLDMPGQLQSHVIHHVLFM